MAANQREQELKEENLNNSWINDSRLHAEELRHLKIRLRGQNAKQSERKQISIANDYFSEQSEWGLQINKYLEVESKGKYKASNPQDAANLATLRVNAERKLTAAIELAKSGYTICSLNSVIPIIEYEELNKEDRVDAFLAVLESIIDTTNAAKKASKDSCNNQELLYELKFTQQLTKALRTAIDSAVNNLNEVSVEIHELIALATKENSPKAYKEEIEGLRIAKSRKLTAKKLSILYKKPVIRTIHHLACTGGTLLAKCLASMHSVALISEINPLNRCGSKFEPTNPLLLLERSHRELSTEERIDIFKIQIKQAFEICQKDDVDLILRDHSHTDFHFGKEVSMMCPLRDCLSIDYDLISVVTVRNPLDSYLALVSNGWEKQFYPNDLNEYSKRYLAFLEKYNELEIIRYEDFCANPLAIMKKLCEILHLEFNKDFSRSFGNKNLSGDSGRTGLEAIEVRQRRPIPKELEPYIENSKYYLELVQQLGY